MSTVPRVRVLCIDDNEYVCEALKTRIMLDPRFEWLGRLPDVNLLAQQVAALRPDLLLLDLDMPGPSALAAITALSAGSHEVKTLIVSGHLRCELIEESLEAGAWGYVHKGEGMDEILSAMEKVARGEIALSPDARTAFMKSAAVANAAANELQS